MKRFFAFLLAVIMCGGISNFLVFADDGGFSNQSQDKSYLELYKNFVDNQNEQSKFTEYLFALYDMDKDNIPELIVKSIDKKIYDINEYKIYGIVNNDVKQLFDYKSDFNTEYIDVFTSGKGSNDFQKNNIYFVMKEAFNSIEPKKYIYIEKVNTSINLQEFSPENFVEKNLLGVPVDFTDYNDKYNVERVFSDDRGVITEYDVSLIEKNPQLCSPQVFITDFNETSENEIYYQNGAYQKGNEYILMINGSFDSSTILNRDEKLFVPLRTVLEKTGKTVIWNNTDKTIDITGQNLSLKLSLVYNFLTNGVKNIDTTNNIITNDGTVFVSAEFLKYGFGVKTGVSENAIDGCKILYIENNYSGIDCFSDDDGVNAIVHNFQLLETQNEWFNVFSENVKYVGDLGRYYIYKVEKDKVYWTNIFFNKYTGEIFTESQGIEKGLIYGQYKKVINGQEITVVS